MWLRREVCGGVWRSGGGTKGGMWWYGVVEGGVSCVFQECRDDLYFVIMN